MREVIDVFDMRQLEAGMGAIDQEAREELRALRPDVLRVAAGLAAGTFTLNGITGPEPDTDGGWDAFAEWVATGALAIVRAVDRVTGGDV